MATVWYGTREAEPLDDVAPWREAELIDRADEAEAVSVELRAKAQRLETELLIARLWVKELALWLEESPAIRRRRPGRSRARPDNPGAPRRRAV